MSPRLRSHIIVTIAMNLFFAYACLLGRGSWGMDSYHIIGQIMPIEVWGYMFLAVAAAMVYGVASQSHFMYRVSLAVSAGILVTWGIALIYNVFQGNTTGPVGPFLLFIVAADRMIIASTPVTWPIEKYQKRQLG